MMRGLLFAAAAATAVAALPRSSRFGKTWDVQYHTNYKVVNVTAGASKFYYVLTDKGASAPSVVSLKSSGRIPSSVTPKFFNVPIAKAALLSTTQIQWAEVSYRARGAAHGFASSFEAGPRTNDSTGHFRTLGSCWMCMAEAIFDMLEFTVQ